MNSPIPGLPLGLVIAIIIVVIVITIVLCTVLICCCLRSEARMKRRRTTAYVWTPTAVSSSDGGGTPSLGSPSPPPATSLRASVMRDVLPRTAPRMSTGTASSYTTNATPGPATTATTGRRPPPPALFVSTGSCPSLVPAAIAVDAADEDDMSLRYAGPSSRKPVAYSHSAYPPRPASCATTAMSPTDTHSALNLTVSDGDFADAETGMTASPCTSRTGLLPSSGSLAVHSRPIDAYKV